MEQQKAIILQVSNSNRKYRYFSSTLEMVFTSFYSDPPKADEPIGADGPLQAEQVGEYVVAVNYKPRCRKMTGFFFLLCARHG